MKTKSLIITAVLCGLGSFSLAQDMNDFAPVVVKTVPESGSKDVPPGQFEVKITFSKEMTDQSWSWCTAWENSDPQASGNPHYEADHKTCVMKVNLEPGKTYGWWINSQNNHGFQDTQNHPAVPYLLTFSTGIAASQPVGVITPATGLPEAGPGGINLATGLLEPSQGDHPAYYKMDTNGFQAAMETWSPPMAPDGKVNLQGIQDEIKDLMDQRRYEEALQRQIWYFNHALEFGEINAIRTSFGIMHWEELARRYPKARQALIEIRDGEARDFSEGRGYYELFMEIQSLNRALHDDDATYVLFQSIREKDPELAQQCYGYIESQLVDKGEYQWCYDHMGDPQSKYETIRRNYEMGLDNQKRMADMQARTRQMMADMNTKNGSTNRPVYTPADNSAMMEKNAENQFVGSVRQLVEILIATGHRPEAEKIRDQALTVLGDDRLKSAVADAQANIKKVI